VFRISVELIDSELDSVVVVRIVAEVDHYPFGTGPFQAFKDFAVQLSFGHAFAMIVLSTIDFLQLDSVFHHYLGCIHLGGGGQLEVLPHFQRIALHDSEDVPGETASSHV